MNHEVHPDIQAIIDTEDSIDQLNMLFQIRQDRPVVLLLLEIIKEQQKIMDKMESDHEDAITEMWYQVRTP